jgi:hypothetical protein
LMIVNPRVLETKVGATLLALEQRLGHAKGLATEVGLHAADEARVNWMRVSRAGPAREIIRRPAGGRDRPRLRIANEAA